MRQFEIHRFLGILRLRFRILLFMRVDGNGKTSFAGLQKKRSSQSQVISQNGAWMRQVDAFGCQQFEKRQLEPPEVFGGRTFGGLQYVFGFASGLRICHGFETFTQITSVYDTSRR